MTDRESSSLYRYFINKFSWDDKNERYKILDKNEQLNEEFVKDLKSFVTNQLPQVLAILEREGIARFRDASVYTGLTGIAMLVWKLSISDYGSEIGERTKMLYNDWCKKLLQESRGHIRKKRITFLCGDSGILAISAVTNKEQSKRYMQEIKDLCKFFPTDKILPDELLYGRSGYLYTLLFVRTHCDEYPELDMDGLIKNVGSADLNSFFSWRADFKSKTHRQMIQVVQAIINEGRKNARDERSAMPLFYSWHGKEYFGAAHGYLGIFYMLLQAKLLVNGSVTQEHDDIIVKCLDSLLEQRFSTGNMKSSMGSGNDTLIHWCHGAPGAVHVYALAYKIYKRGNYLDAAQLFGKVIWERGLLKKGCGLCHGVAGNGYGFLCLYQLTGEKSYLWKAATFAQWCLGHGSYDVCRADMPLSLMEGVAGTLYFLNDILQPNSAAFPAFQLMSYNMT